MELDMIKKYAHADDKSAWAEMSMEDRLLFYECRDLYSAFDNGRLSKEKCMNRMNESVTDWKRNARLKEVGTTAQKRLAHMYQSIQTASDAFRKKPDVITALALMTELYGLNMKIESEDTE